MKRYIRSTSDHDKLKYEKDGETCYLPTWFLYRSDEEIEKAKQELINEPTREYTDDDYEEIEIDERDLRKQLRSEGFDRNEIDEIIAMVYNGHTIDSAIQRQLDRRERK